VLGCIAVPWLFPRLTWPIPIADIEAFLLLARVEETDLILRPSHHLGHLRTNIVLEVICNCSKSAIAIQASKLCLAIEIELDIDSGLNRSIAASRPHSEHIGWNVAYLGLSRSLEVDPVTVCIVLGSKSVNVCNKFVL
jgi:hypothetical protein